jgi:hypothetical protein
LPILLHLLVGTCLQECALVFLAERGSDPRDAAAAG